MVRQRWRWSSMALVATLLVLLGSFFLGLNHLRRGTQVSAVCVPTVLLGLAFNLVRLRPEGWRFVPSPFALLGTAIVGIVGYVAGMRAEVTDFGGFVYGQLAAALGLYLSQLGPARSPGDPARPPA